VPARALAETDRARISGALSEGRNAGVSEAHSRRRFGAGCHHVTAEASRSHPVYWILAGVPAVAAPNAKGQSGNVPSGSFRVAQIYA
jgi:hypothetical protein